MALLEIDGLVARYGRITALNGISLTVDEGEIVALIGANGAGKTTTLRAISGLVRATSGTIQFDGRSITGQSPSAIVRAGIGHAPEGRHVFPRMTVRENLELGAYTRTRAAVRDGTIDAFATDHAPHTREEKAQLLADAPVGFTGLEIALGAYAFALPDLPLARFVALGSTNPARILGLAGGTLKVGAPADVTVFADRQWRVDSTKFYSLGKNTPFEGALLPRRALATIVGGELVMRDGIVRVETPSAAGRR